MCFPVPYAGFFATHNNLFFNVSFLYVCLPPLKNDGTRGLRFLLPFYFQKIYLQRAYFFVIPFRAGVQGDIIQSGDSVFRSKAFERRRNVFSVLDVIP